MRPTKIHFFFLAIHIWIRLISTQVLHARLMDSFLSSQCWHYSSNLIMTLFASGLPDWREHLLHYLLFLLWINKNNYKARTYNLAHQIHNLNRQGDLFRDYHVVLLAFKISRDGYVVDIDWQGHYLYPSSNWKIQTHTGFIPISRWGGSDRLRKDGL